MYYFLRITPANVLYALWLKRRAPIAAWKVEASERLTRGIGRVRPYHVWSRDEWLLAHDHAFTLWKTVALPLLVERHRHTVELSGRLVDFSRNLWQLLGMEFEALCLFAGMVEKSHAAGSSDVPRIVAPRIGAAFTADELKQLFPAVHVVPSPLNRLLENLHEWLISAAHLGRELAFFAASFAGRRRRLGPRAVAWLGISPQEIPDRDDRLDFAWAARHGYVPAADVVYFLSHEATPAQRRYLESRQIAYVEPDESFSVLPVGARVRAVARSLTGWLAAARQAPIIAPLLARLLARAPHWDALFTELGTATYVTTTSFSWPEKPELAVASARRIRTIIWAYSANSLTFTHANRAFRDLGVVRSIVIADEFWVWNRAYGRWLEKRRLDAPGGRCEIRVVGPLMCGDPHWLERGRAAARERLGLPARGLCIGVFDMPPLSDAWRDRFGGGPPMVDTETYVAFWKIIEAIVLRIPGSYALVKLKRDFSHIYREFPAFLRSFVDEDGEHARAGRVHCVDVNVDPYLPVAACDVAIGIAYTSPVLAARAAGRPGYYLDPLRRATFPSDREYTLITLHTEEEMVKAVMRAREADALFPAPSITPPPPTVPLGAADESATSFD